MREIFRQRLPIEVSGVPREVRDTRDYPAAPMGDDYLRLVGKNLAREREVAHVFFGKANANL
jgi:hypothetical protein